MQGRGRAEKLASPSFKALSRNIAKEQETVAAVPTRLNAWRQAQEQSDMRPATALWSQMSYPEQRQPFKLVV